MSFFADLGRDLRSAFDKVVQVGRQLIRVAQPIVRDVVQKAKEFVDKITKKVGRAFRDDPKCEREFIERQLQDVNSRAMTLRARYQSTGRMSHAENGEWQRLKERRKELMGQLDGLDAVDLAQDIVNEEDNYKLKEVTDQDAHLIDMVAGQNTYGKQCPNWHCNRAMVLQWKRGIQTPRLADFFWGCSGWYIALSPARRACYMKVPLAPADFHIFGNLKRPEFAVTAAHLTRRVMDVGKRKRLREALDSIRVDHRKRDIGIATYRCPVHGESLRLQRSSVTSGGLLDEYFLGCPRWLTGNAGCNFILKLKSPGRISSVLEAEQGRGVLAALDN